VSGAYRAQDWTEFFLAAAGAAAALSGLIFLGLSVNIRTVLDADQRVGQNFLTGRAVEALVALLNVLAVSPVALTPAISRGVLAAFILLVAAEAAISPVRQILALRRQPGFSAVQPPTSGPGHRPGADAPRGRLHFGR
jgi:hypothetical protein